MNALVGRQGTPTSLRQGPPPAPKAGRFWVRQVAVFAIVTLVIANAGCLGEAEKKSPLTTTPVVTQKNETLPPLLVHLAANGKVTVMAPNGTTTGKTPTRVPSGFAGTPPSPVGGGRAEWIITMATNGTVQKYVGKVFVEVAEQTVAGPGFGQGQQCRFSVSISKVSAGGGGGGGGSGGQGPTACVTATPGPVEKGEVSIPINLQPTTPVAVKAGDQFRIRVNANVVSPQERAVVNVLHGSAKHDSFVEFVNANLTLAVKV